MIRSLQYYQTDGTVPFENLALEAWLLESVAPETCILYLWQNRNTVVIGKNQNVWKECRVADLERDDGYLVRRLSGGGAVYHDLGNLNFTFLVPTADYNLDRQLEVILRAVRSFGLDARKTGRNDITVEGRKFSGNAFYHSGGHSYHHGTLLVNVDMDGLSRYLNVSAQKLQSKGVESVRSRVVNLSELSPEITVASLAVRLIEAFGEGYGLAPSPIDKTALDQQRLEALTERFSDWNWRFGRKIPFTWEIESRFLWGGVQIGFQVERGVISTCAVYSDAMEEAVIAAIPPLLQGCPFAGKEMAGRLASLTPQGKQIVEDIRCLLGSQSF